MYQTSILRMSGYNIYQLIHRLLMFQNLHSLEGKAPIIRTVFFTCELSISIVVSVTSAGINILDKIVFIFIFGISESVRHHPMCGSLFHPDVIWNVSPYCFLHNLYFINESAHLSNGNTTMIKEQHCCRWDDNTTLSGVNGHRSLDNRDEGPG